MGAVTIVIVGMLLFIIFILLAIYGLLDRIANRFDNFCSAILRHYRDVEDD